MNFLPVPKVGFSCKSCEVTERAVSNVLCDVVRCLCFGVSTRTLYCPRRVSLPLLTLLHVSILTGDTSGPSNSGSFCVAAGEQEPLDSPDLELVRLLAAGLALDRIVAVDPQKK